MTLIARFLSQYKTQDEAARALGVHSSSVSGWATGRNKPRRETQAKMRKLLEKSDKVIIPPSSNGFVRPEPKVMSRTMVDGFQRESEAEMILTSKLPVKLKLKLAALLLEDK